MLKSKCHLLRNMVTSVTSASGASGESKACCFPNGGDIVARWQCYPCYFVRGVVLKDFLPRVVESDGRTPSCDNGRTR